MRLVSGALLAVLLLTGCTDGGDSDDTAADDPATSATRAPDEGDNAPGGSDVDVPDGPDCRDIWKSGETLPEDFTVCVLDGRVPEFDVTECLDGSKLVVADNVMWGRTGQGEIRRATESPLQDGDEYGTDYALCTGR